MSTNYLTRELDLALDSFLLEVQSRNLSPKTLKYYSTQLDWFFSFCGQLDSLPDITPHVIRKYIVHLQSIGWSPASQHTAARAIRAFLNFCVNDGWIDSSPMDRVKLPRVPQNVKPAFEYDDIHRLLNVADRPRDKAIILCLLDSGCRAREFLAWNVGDVNISTGVVQVRKTKNKLERTVYLGKDSRKALIQLYRYLDTSPDNPIWLSHNSDERLGYSGLQIMLRRLGKRADVAPCNPHRFRRTFALFSLRNGMNVYALQKIMGHSDLTILKRYLALVESDLRDAHFKFGVVDNL